MNKPQLLLPAGNMDAFKTALLYGADAVYAGLPSMNLRSRENFPIEDLQECIKKSHSLGKKTYLALNLFSRNKDIAKLDAAISTIKFLNPDGLIISDPGIFAKIKKEIPDLPLNVSTQANVCSWLTVDFWQKQGAALCVLGREVSFKEAVEIREKCPDTKLEIFVHGAMCISYSGRCLLSAFMASRSANAGLCAHSCRWKYKSKLVLEEEMRPNEFLELYEDEQGSYILNSKDLCLMPKLNQILCAGFDSLKIEGRNKSEYYIAQTARAYRKAIDDYFENPKDWKADIYMQELLTLQNRGYTTAFFDGVPDGSDQNFNDTASISDWQSAGIVKGYKDCLLEIEVKNKIQKGQEIELLSPYQFEPFKIVIDKMIDGKNNKEIDLMSAGKTGQTIKIPIKDAKLFPKYTVARKRCPSLQD
ncbi:MAG: U32 family peptidase C-terminal domain-containing protein [Elusimicrobiota bacterium]|jgi:putative protease|nr:U32 family peptidase C-terminal domain-containing protein [Elusimicrobiota bacterium]